MSSVASELVRLGRAQARARAAPWARRVHLLLLAAAVLLAGVHRWLVPVPGLQALEAHVLAALFVALLLWLAGPLLSLLAPWLLREAPARVAGRLDAAPGGHDEVATALDVEQGRAPGALGPVLVARVAHRLAAQGPPPSSTPARARLLRAGGALAFLALLLLPGVRGGGAGTAGRGPQPGLGWRPQGIPEALDADAWLRQHLRLVLEPVPAPADAAGLLRLRLALAAPLPTGVALRARLELLWDDADDTRRAQAEVGEVAAAAGSELAPLALDLDLRTLPALAGRLTPGLHVAQARLVPLADPFRQAQRSAPLEVEIQPPPVGGAPPPGPDPQPPPPASPPPPPEATDGPPEPAPVPAGGREEAIVPFIHPGETVRKERAVVAARAPDAAPVPPPPQPLEEALREPARAAEQAVARERIAPADRELVRRYFQVLRRLVEPGER